MAKTTGLKKVAKQIANKESLTPESTKKISDFAQKKMAEVKSKETDKTKKKVK